MISLIIYMMFSVLWGIYASKKQRCIFGENVISTGILNAIFAPICMVIAIVNGN
jgi:hypothetical protein